MKYLISLILIVFSSEVIAQELSVSGSLVDAQENSIPFANVLILDENQTVLTGTSSSEDGQFSFSNLEAKRYTIKISFIGFKDFIETFTLVKNKSFGIISLQEASETLGEVTINTARPTLTREADRLVFNVANSALSEGTLLEVIRSTPGVLVLGDVITVKNSPPTVYINDKKVNLSAGEITQLLENSPANTIKKVEVITDPPAKYDGDSGVVINIVMSRNLITGYRGNVFSRYTQGVYPRVNTGVNQFYKTNKINLNLNYSYTSSKKNKVSESNINYLDDNNSLTQNWQAINDRNTKSKTHNANFNFDYFINDKNTLSVVANGLLLPKFIYRIKNNTKATSPLNENLFNIEALNKSDDEKYNLGFDLDFKHQINTNSKLIFNAHFTDYFYKREQEINSSYFLPDNADNFKTAFKSNNNQDTNIYSSQLDYTSQIDDNTDFEAGLKFSFINTDSFILRFDNDLNTGTSSLNLENSDAYNYEEYIMAAYLSYSKNWNKFNFTGGLRVEETNLKGLTVTDNIKNTQDYLEFFPKLNLSYSISDNATIFTSYNRSITRPGFQLLNPYNFFLNDNSIVSGNSSLKPEFRTKYILGARLYDFLTLEVFYLNNEDAIYEIPIQNSLANTLTSTPLNIGKINEYGFDVEFYKSVTERLYVYAVNRIANIESFSTFQSFKVSQNQWYNFTILSLNYSFLKDNSLNSNLTFTHTGKNLAGLRRIDSRLSTELSISKKILKNKGVLSLSASDLFNTHDFGLETRYTNQDNYFFYDLDDRYIKLGFSYKFGNTTLRTNERKKDLEERDRLEKK